MSISENGEEPTTTKAATPADVVRGLYEALRVGDVPGVLARLDPDVIVDEPLALPYGGVHHGREVFVQSVLGTMMGHAEVDIAEVTVFEGADGVVGTLTARASGERFSLTMVELHEVVGDTIRKMDIYTKNPELLAGFYARAAASRGASMA